jgi:hypothetical protein
MVHSLGYANDEDYMKNYFTGVHLIKNKNGKMVCMIGAFNEESRRGIFRCTVNKEFLFIDDDGDVTINLDIENAMELSLEIKNIIEKYEALQKGI